MYRIFSISSPPAAQRIDPRIESVKPSVCPGARGLRTCSEQMQAVPWNVKTVKNDAGSTDVVWNNEPEGEHQHRQNTNFPDSSMASTLLLNFETELRREEQSDVIKEHGSGNPRVDMSAEDSRATFMLTDILEEALSPVLGYGNADPIPTNVNENGEEIKCARYRANLTEEERRAERNRKGRERSLRTRRRNAAHLKMLEDGCTRLIMENRLLRDLLNCLQREPLLEEKVISLLRILICNSRFSSSFRPAVKLLEGFAAPSRSSTSITFRKTIAEVGDHQAPFACGEVSQTCTLPGNAIGMANIGDKNKSNMSVALWEPEQTTERLPESCNQSNTSMTTRKSTETRVDGFSEDQFQSSVNRGNDTPEGDRSVLADFGMDEIDAVISL
eukprot:TRINITY_DN136_c0_g1_i1.p3 TRINITY_DN136_c0_g1~~TRINITY_DN136_c0_g1_i1.p3  ORF type:complete len:387 (-),score=58.39 TRINITY_DN136_c0_g1_i1:123-1283(-)